MTTPNSYDPEFVEAAGFGQSTGNPEPSTFIESIAINKDCSVYQNLFVGKVIEGKSSLAISGPGSFGGIVSAAGFRYGGRSFFGANQFVVEAPATFLNTLTTAAAPSTFNGFVNAAVGLAAEALAVAPVPDIPRFDNTNLEDGFYPYYRPTDGDGNYIRTPIEFVPCYLNALPANAVVLAYIPDAFRN